LLVVRVLALAFFGRALAFVRAFALALGLVAFGAGAGLAGAGAGAGGAAGIGVGVQGSGSPNMRSIVSSMVRTIGSRLFTLRSSGPFSQEEIRRRWSSAPVRRARRGRDWPRPGRPSAPAARAPRAGES